MKVKDFIEIIRPITAVNPDAEIKFTRLDCDHSSSVLIQDDHVYLALKCD